MMNMNQCHVRNNSVGTVAAPINSGITHCKEEERRIIIMKCLDSRVAGLYNFNRLKSSITNCFYT